MNKYLTEGSLKKDRCPLYLDLVKRIALESYCVRLQVGALIEKDGNIISFSFNGTAKGRPNVCEIEVDGQLVSLDEVLHAESNAITKACKSPISTEGATLYCTHSCCIHCAKIIVQSGITRFIYINDYRDSKGIKFLQDCGVEVIKAETLIN
jgi:dCMP deaminase